MNFKDHKKVLQALKEAQEAERDQREAAREAKLFVEKRDGQWEPYWWNASDGKPRYTFDMTGAIVDQISGGFRQRDFDIKILPGDGHTSKENAKLYDGIVRHIESQSKAKHIYWRASRNMTISGLDGWHIVQEYADPDSFYQDIRIKYIPDYLDSVWFDPNSMEPDRSDSRYGFLLEAMYKEAYEDEYPDRAGVSVPIDREACAYDIKPDQILIGQIYYIVEKKRILVQTDKGRVMELVGDRSGLEQLLATRGERIVETRKSTKNVVYSRLFDGRDWLGPAEETVFSYVPLVPACSDFNVVEHKIIYKGVVERLMDPQRVYNYAKSREIEEGALAPRAKYWMTTKQAAGHERTLRTLNTNADPVQFYNPDPEADNPPKQQGGAEINQGLIGIGESMRQLMGQVAGMFAASMGDNPGLQSGYAIEKLQEKGDNGAAKFYEALETAIAHTGRIIVDAIPRVYNTERQMQLVGADGTIKPVVVNRPVYDAETGRFLLANDLANGRYSVVCTSGPSFENRQQETVSTLTEVAQVDPSVLEIGGDILFANMTAPGMDMIAARKRAQLINAGLIPMDQMTPEEQKQAQAAQQNKQPDPNMMIAQAEVKKAEAQTQRVVADSKGKSAQMMLAARRLQLDERRQSEQSNFKRLELQMQMQNDRFDHILSMQESLMNHNNSLVQQLNTQAQTLKLIREAMGVEAIVGPEAIDAFAEQVEEVRDSQEKVAEPNDETVRGGTPALPTG